MKTLEEKIEVMQAALDGEEIECVKLDSGNAWLSMNDETIHWNWPYIDYRIKPKPLEFWVNVYNGGSARHCYTSEDGALRNKSENIVRTIKVQEVIE